MIFKSPSYLENCSSICTWVCIKEQQNHQKLVEYLDPSTQVYGRTREGTSPVLKEQVRKLKKRHPWVNIMIIPEPCQGKSALTLVKLSVQHEH